MTDFVLSEPGNLRLPRRFLELIPGILVLLALAAAVLVRFGILKTVPW